MLRVWLAALACVSFAQGPSSPPPVLPAAAANQLQQSLVWAAPHAMHVWRDTAPINADGTVNAYIEIPRGERRKFEFDMRRHRRIVDRTMPPGLAYPVNYGFVPQTVSYDGDPFDVLVLGPALPGGRLVRGAIVGLMHMEDEKGLDSKVVVSPLGPGDVALYSLDDRHRARLADYFSRYKRHEGKASVVPGWGDEAEGRAFVRATHAFFRTCQATSGECRLEGVTP